MNRASMPKDNVVAQIPEVLQLPIVRGFGEPQPQETRLAPFIGEDRREILDKMRRVGLRTQQVFGA